MKYLDILKAKKEASSILSDISDHGKEGGRVLRSILDAHRPKAIFAMPRSPERDFLISKFLAEARSAKSRIESKSSDASLQAGSRGHKKLSISGARRVAQRIADDAVKYGGDSAAEDIADIMRDRKAKSVWSAPASFDRDVEVSRIIEDLKGIRDFYKKSYKDPRKTTTSKPASRSRQIVPAAEKITGRHDGFSYTIVKVGDRAWMAKINRRGRDIIPHPEAPHLLNSQALRSPFKSIYEAEIAVRRLINSVMIWYSSKGIIPKERIRKTSARSMGVKLRTSVQRTELDDDDRKDARSKRRYAKREKQRARRREERVVEIAKDTRARDAESPKMKGQVIERIIKDNPSTAYSELRADVGRAKAWTASKFEGIKDKAKYAAGNSKSGKRPRPSSANIFRPQEESGVSGIKLAMQRAGDGAVSAFELDKKAWLESLSGDEPNFSSLIRMHEEMSAAKVYYRAANNKKLYAEASKIVKKIRTTLVGVLKVGYRAATPHENPSRVRRVSRHMVAAKSAWNRYLKDTGPDSHESRAMDLNQSLLHLFAARGEYTRAGEPNLLADVDDKILMVKSEISALEGQS